MTLSELWGRHSTRYEREVVPRTRNTEQRFQARWRAAAEGCGLANLVHVAAGVTVSCPRLGGVRLDEAGEVASVMVQRHPGQSLADYRAVSVRLADALGCARVRFTDLGADRWMRLALLGADPLAVTHRWTPNLPPGFLAFTEEGRLMAARWQHRPHTVVQGSTGSGKSAFVYGQLAPLAGRRDALVAGVDPSGLIFRPWDDQPGAGWRVSGLRDDLIDHRRVLRELVREMDTRLAFLPEGTDNLVTDEATPLVVVVLEEFAALVRAAELIDRKVGQEVRALVGRLHAEGRKVGVRCLLVVQRADAAVIDGPTRAQATLRVSFASDPDGLRMLHPTGVVDPDEHSVAAPGVAVVTGPRIGSLRVRTAHLGYREYCSRVRAAA